jgi:hypothetical protein
MAGKFLLLPRRFKTTKWIFSVIPAKILDKKYGLIIIWPSCEKVPVIRTSSAALFR